MLISEMTIAECRSVLVGARIGRLACARDNQPYVVPFNFAHHGEHLYAFSTLGQKIEWMRTNPLVCVEVDEMKHQSDWTSVIVFGRYEELPDKPEFENERVCAHELLSCHAMWWQPAYVATAHPGQANVPAPIYFRIRIERMTGHRATADAIEGGEQVGERTPHHNWWRSLWSRGEAKPH